MNQMEAFKWEQKRLSLSKEKERDRGKDRESEQRRSEARDWELAEKAEQRREDERREKELNELELLVQAQARRSDQGLPDLLEAAYPPTSSTNSVRSSSPTEKRAADTNSSITSNQSLTFANTSDTADESASSTYSRPPLPRTDSSESIYAHIIRRLNALEANSTLVARYIEEQTRVMRLMLGRVELGWDRWKAEWEGEDRGRWDQEVRSFAFVSSSAAHASGGPAWEGNLAFGAAAFCFRAGAAGNAIADADSG
jgi:hypothetical protein